VKIILISYTDVIFPAFYICMHSVYFITKYTCSLMSVCAVRVDIVCVETDGRKMIDK